jgi:hypothetical protein
MKHFFCKCSRFVETDLSPSGVIIDTIIILSLAGQKIGFKTVNGYNYFNTVFDRTILPTVPPHGQRLLLLRCQLNEYNATHRLLLLNRRRLQEFPICQMEQCSNFTEPLFDVFNSSGILFFRLGQHGVRLLLLRFQTA